MVYNLHAVTEDLTITKGSLNDLTEVVQFHSALTNFTQSSCQNSCLVGIFCRVLIMGCHPLFSTECDSSFIISLCI